MILLRQRAFAFGFGGRVLLRQIFTYLASADFVLFCVFFVFAQSAAAEVLQLKSGEKIQGKILQENKDSYLVDAGIDTPLTYFKDEIKAVLPDGEDLSIDLPSVVNTQADEIENKAVAAIDAGQMDKGLELMRQAIAMDPAPSREMNYGSVLFGNGVSLFKSGKTEQAKTILTEAREHLIKAVEGFDSVTDAAFLSQSYFWLGEIERNGFDNAVKAKEYYQKSLSTYANEGAKAALKQLP